MSRTYPFQGYNALTSKPKQEESPLLGGEIEAGVAQWTERQTVKWKVTGSVSGRGVCLSCRPGPHLGACERQLIGVSHIDVSVSCPLKISKIFNARPHTQGAALGARKAVRVEQWTQRSETEGQGSEGCVCVQAAVQTGRSGVRFEWSLEESVGVNWKGLGTHPAEQQEQQTKVL